MCPCIDNLIVTLLVGDEAHVVVVHDGLYLPVTLLYDARLLLRDNDIVEVEGQSGHVCHTVTEVLDTIEERTGACHTYSLDNISDDAAKGFLGDDIVEEAHLVRNDAIYDDTTD